jgi:hypothetical protein
MHDLYLANQSHLINILTTFQLVYLCQAYVGPVSEGYGRQLSSQSEGHTINGAALAVSVWAVYVISVGYVARWKHSND